VSTRVGTCVDFRPGVMGTVLTVSYYYYYYYYIL